MRDFGRDRFTSRSTGRSTTIYSCLEGPIMPGPSARPRRLRLSLICANADSRYGDTRGRECPWFENGGHDQRLHFV